MLLWLLRRLQSPISRSSDGLPPARNTHSSVRLSLIARRRVGIEGRRQAEGKGLRGGELFLVDGDKKMEGLSGEAPYCKRGTVVGPRHEAGMRRFSLTTEAKFRKVVKEEILYTFLDDDRPLNPEEDLISIKWVVSIHIPLKTLIKPKIAKLFENGNLKVEIC